MSDAEPKQYPLARTQGADRKRSVRGYVWGYNNAGGLGIGSVARAVVPVPVVLPEDTVDVQGGTDFTVALTSTGQVWTWGGNSYGQLGDGSSSVRLKPHLVQLPGHAKVGTISVGAHHVLVLTRGGAVFGWGRNLHGQLGDGTRADRQQPVRIATGPVVQLATGIASSHAVTSGGALLSWGRPIGRDATSTVSPGEQSTPGSFTLPGGAKVAMVDAGERHLVVLTRRGQLLTFGVDAVGRPLPIRLRSEQSWGRITWISAGDVHTVALTSTGKVLAWGANYHGQLGARDITNRDRPVLVRIPNLRGHVVEVVAGGDSVLVRTSRQDIYTWGQGRFGQNGDGTTDDQTRPHRVKFPDTKFRDTSRITGVHAGRYHYLILTNQRRDNH